MRAAKKNATNNTCFLILHERLGILSFFLLCIQTSATSSCTYTHHVYVWTLRFRSNTLPSLNTNHDILKWCFVSPHGVDWTCALFTVDCGSEQNIRTRHSARRARTTTIPPIAAPQCAIVRCFCDFTCETVSYTNMPAHAGNQYQCYNNSTQRYVRFFSTGGIR